MFKVHKFPQPIESMLTESNLIKRPFSNFIKSMEIKFVKNGIETNIEPIKKRVRCLKGYFLKIKLKNERGKERRLWKTYL